MSFSHSSMTIELAHPSELNARCRNHVGALCFSSIDLNTMLGNDNGRFRFGGQDALKEASRAWLDGAVLCAELLVLSGLYVNAKVDLDQLITNDNGCLKWVDTSPSISRSSVYHEENDNLEILSKMTEASWSTSEATSLKQSLSTSLIRPAIFCAEVPRADGGTDRLPFDLDQIFRNGNGRLGLTFDPCAGHFSTSSQNMRVDGTMFAAELQGLNGEYIRHTVDLDHILAIEDGRLVLNSAGPGCSNCNDLFRMGRWYRPDGSRKVEVSGLSDPVSQNCAFCRLLRRGFVAYCRTESSPNFDSMKATIETTSLMEYAAVKVSFTKKDIPRSDQIEVRCALYATKGSANQSITFDGIPTKQFRESKLSREDRIKFIRTLIDTCASGHDHCSPTRSSPLPKRILDLFAKNQSGVCIYQSEGEVAEYACLSHCWGQSRSAMLTKDNLPEYQHHVSLGLLPRTYRDAISYCRSLDIRYLWIDSLCILQDDDQDWIAESTKMAAYYGNCVVCIAATSSMDHDDGCEINEFDNISAKGIGQDGLPFDIHLGSLVSNSHFWEVPTASYIHSFPLLTRAWVYQERYLSPRVVHFCRVEIVFECRHMTTCECGQYIHKDRGRSNNKIRSWTKTISPGSVDETLLAHSKWITYARPDGGLSDPWHDLIESYSQLLLTFPRDRLPAFSGLASDQLNDRNIGNLGHRYLAGIREDRLIQDLLWFVGGSATGFLTTTHLLYAQRARSPIYTAPSWSWASVTEQVRFAYPTDISETLCNITKLDVSLSNSTAPFGEVVSGHLLVEGKLFPSTWGIQGDNEAPMSYHLWDWEVHQGNNHYTGKHFYPDFTLTNRGVNIAIDASERLYVLPLVRFKGHDNVAAVALRQISSKADYDDVDDERNHDSTKVFERVGWVWRWTAAEHNDGNVLPSFPYDVQSSVFKII